MFLSRSPLYYAIESGMSSIILLLYELHKDDANLISTIMNRPAAAWVGEDDVSHSIGLVHVAVIQKQLAVLSLLIELVNKALSNTIPLP